MIIYGVALLAFCFLTGNYIGDILGALLGVKANVGGVGFAMLLLIILTNKGIDAGWLDKKGQEGIAFWSAMYIPIVVAMSSIQDVVAALHGGTVAVLGGILGVVLGFLYSYFKKIWCIVIKRMGGVLYGLRSNVRKTYYQKWFGCSFYYYWDHDLDCL